MNSRFYNQNQDPLSFYQDFEQNHRLRQQEQQQHQFSEALTCGSQNGFWSSSVQGQHCNSGYFIKSLFFKVNKIFTLCLDPIHADFQQKISLEKNMKKSHLIV